MPQRSRNKEVNQKNTHHAFHMMELIAACIGIIVIILGSIFLAYRSFAGSGTVGDDSMVDFNLGTYSDTAFVTDSVELDATGKTNGTGTFTSRIFDAGDRSFWNTLSWVPEAPYSKELPNSEGVETAYGSSNIDMSDNVLLFHMNEASWSGVADEVIDSSGNGNDGIAGGDATTTDTDPKFNRSGTFDGTGDYISVADDSSLDFTTAFTVMGWFYFDTDIGSVRLIAKESGGTFSYRLLTLDGGIFGQNDSLIMQISTDGTSVAAQTLNNGSLAAFKDQWVFLASVYDGVTLDTWINDTKIGSVAAAVGSLINTSVGLGVGADASGTFDFDGKIDEVALFDDDFTDAEIIDIYERGALRMKYQVRSCNDAACTGETFIGPDGTAATYYSEEQNSTVGLPSINLTNIDKNQYFQYEATLETDDATKTPELDSVTIAYSTSGGSIERVFPHDMSMLINNGVECTKERQVSLSLSAQGSSQVIYANDTSFLGQEWEPFTGPTQTVSWELDQYEGEQTVYAIFQSPTSDKSIMQSASIVLDSVGMCGEVVEDALAVEEAPIESKEPTADEQSTEDATPTADEVPTESNEAPAIIEEVTEILPPEKVEEIEIVKECFIDETFTFYMFPLQVDTDIRRLQYFLQCKGFFPAEKKPTGFYGPLTIDAVELFQIEQGLDPIGVVGPATRKALNTYLLVD